MSRLKHALCVLDTLHVFVLVGEEEEEEEDEITNFKDRSFLSAVKNARQKTKSPKNHKTGNLSHMPNIPKVRVYIKVV